MQWKPIIQVCDLTWKNLDNLYRKYILFLKSQQDKIFDILCKTGDERADFQEFQKSRWHHIQMHSQITALLIIVIKISVSNTLIINVPYGLILIYLV